MDKFNEDYYGGMRGAGPKSNSRLSQTVMSQKSKKSQLLSLNSRPLQRLPVQNKEIQEGNGEVQEPAEVIEE